MRKTSLTIIATMVFAIGFIGANTTSANAGAKKCRQWSPSAIICWTATSVPSAKSELVEQVSFTNRLKRPIGASCSFEKTVNRSVSAGVSLTVGAKASLFKVVEAETSLGITASVEQSATTATKIATNFAVPPGVRVFCKRYYRYLKTRIQETNVSGSSISNREYYVNVPRLVDVVVSSN